MLQGFLKNNSLRKTNLVVLSLVSLLASGCFSSEMDWGNALFSSNGDSTSSSTNDLNISSDSMRVAVGDDSTCVIQDGELACAGDLAQFTLGVNFSYNTNRQCTASSSTNLDCVYDPIEVSETLFGDRVIDIDHGKGAVCAVYYPSSNSKDRAVACWGYTGGTDYGLFGVNRNTTAPYEQVTPAPIIFPAAAANLEINSVEVGSGHACVEGYDSVLLETQVWCWGNNRAGQIAVNPSTFLMSPTPVKIDFPAGYSIRQLAVGYDHNCVIARGPFNTGDESGVFCWGSNRWGQLGRPANNGQAFLNCSSSFYCEVNISSVIESYGPVHFLVEVESIAAQGDKTCAITTSNQFVRCWGRGEYESFGTGSTAFNAANTDCGVLSSLPSTSHTCVPQFARNFDNVATNDRVVGAEGVALSEHSTCIIQNNGSGVPKEVKCWGLNTYGQFSNGVTNIGSSQSDCTSHWGVDCLDGAEQVYVEVAGDDLSSISMGMNSVCVLNNDRPVCLGRNLKGQMGNGFGADNLASPYIQSNFEYFNF